ncbi:SgcJ/EcaC family oxidoreductase [Cognatishimia sp. F0-27]|uniref:YybH family protein n=1 Tax=Cognatishimia sp. F0-27 TaxID=2816855 RepID=UPI001D0C7CBD
MPTRIEPPADPEGFAEAFAAAWASREGDAIAALFTEDADFVNVTGLWWHGRAAIAKPHDYALKSFFARSELRPGRSETRRLAETVAVQRCRFRLDGQRTPDGQEAGPRHTILTFVLVRQADGWRAASAQNTDVVPGKETFVAGPDGLTATDYRSR